MSQTERATGIRPQLHAEIDGLQEEHLEIVQQLLRDFKMRELFKQMSAQAEEDVASGSVAPDKIAGAIAEHRACHPYP